MEWTDTAALPLDDSGFLKKRAEDCATGGRKTVEDDGMKFLVYDAGSESRRFQVFWGRQLFHDGCPSVLEYYVIRTVDAPLVGQTQQDRICFADWLIREADWEQLYVANDWQPYNSKAMWSEWIHLDFL